MLIIRDWADVDRALENIGLLDLEIGELSSSLGRKLYELLGEYSGEILNLTERQRALGACIESFCLLNKGEFSQKRSKQLRYGKIAFRVSERIEVPEELEDSAIAALKRLGHSACIELRERIDRNSLKKLTDTDLSRCGIRRTREDHFRIEPDIKLITNGSGRKDSAERFSVDLQKLEKAIRRNGNKEGEESPVAEREGSA
ncbi:MAG: host-nuclease inhibitor Gam family protein [Syntrophobacteraceae bacterium]